MAGRGEHLLEGLPEAERPVADGEFGRDGEPAGLQVDKELPPALGALARADLEADEFLLALRRGADHSQHAFGGRLHACLEVDPIRPDVDVAAGRQITATPGVVFALPGRRQPRDHRRREVRRILPRRAASTSWKSPVEMPRR
jgi:hypothetical protein